VKINSSFKCYFKQLLEQKRMDSKRLIGYILMILAGITFLLYLIFPFLNLPTENKLLIIAGTYIINKVFFYSSLYFLGKQIIVKIASYLPEWAERFIFRILKVQKVVQNKTTSLA